jgi:hypothetical protein|uniref:Uncharacterized protein n=1 Tax=viral metagenome TaxID=1070528 RepID=A0A6C0D1P1_9ZZZZ
MKFLLVLISASSVFSLSKKLCINCKHFIKPEGHMNGKCSLFPILNDIEEDDNRYMDAESIRKIRYMCGNKGRYYEKIIPVEVPPFLSLVDPAFFDQISEFDFEQYIQFL